MKSARFLREPACLPVLLAGFAPCEAATEPVAKKMPKLDFESLVMIRRQPLNPTHVYTYHVEGLKQGGGLYVMDLADGKPKRILNATNGVILDCQVSYDGTRILFSWKRTMEEPYGIWTVDGSGLTRVMDHDSNNMNACWLPDEGIAFLSDRKPAFACCWTSTSPVLYRAHGDGKNGIRLSANYLTDFTPSVMQDGRILFSRWEYVDCPAIPIQSLWAVKPDGTMLSGVFGNRVLSPATFMEARDIPGRPGRILCVMTSHNGPCRSAIGMVDLSVDGMGWYSAQPVRPRPLPRSAPVSRLIPDARPFAEVLMHDVTNGLGDAVKKGEVKRIAVIQEMEKDIRSETSQRQFGFQFPVVSCGATYAPSPAHYTMASFASSRPAQKLEEPGWGNKDGFSFARAVQPVLNKNCVSCHDHNSDLDLSGDRTDYSNVAYENLVRRGTQAEHGADARGGMKHFGRNPYTSWIPTYNGCESNILEIQPRKWGSPASRLADIIINGHPDEKGDERFDLTDEERLRILDCFKDVPSALEKRIDVDYRKVIGGEQGMDPVTACKTRP